MIFKHAIESLPEDRRPLLTALYTQFERQHGDKAGIESVTLARRRKQYEEKVTETPNDYDLWFDYTRLEESSGELEQIRDVYERAIANVPPTLEKRHWRRYIYLWLYYALFEETQAQDIERARQVYKQCLKIVPHKHFTFAKVWLLYARFEIRRDSIATARKILGTALGKCPKDKLYKAYIELEIEVLFLQA